MAMHRLFFYNNHYGTQTRCRRPAAIDTAKNVVGIVCVDGYRWHIAVSIGGVGTGYMAVCTGLAVGIAIARWQ
jgi:hypothetical protein